MRKISRSDLFRLYLKSFFIQTGWTYDRMLALGFVWIFKPLIRKFYSIREEQREFLKRHLVSFNANPYLAGYALGAVTKLEEEKTPPGQILRFKELLRGPLGALGDCLFWQNFRPALLILGLILAERFGIWGVLGAWLIFNLYQIYLRARGIVKGYNLGMNISSDLNQGHLQSMIRWSSRMGAGFLGVLLVFKYHQLSMQAWEPEKIIPFLAFILLSFLSFKRNINPGYILFSSLVIFLGLKVLLS
jgi:mannose/fructose/N-acetylgalactosamine-specific phosphotransferase system component IID